MKKAFDYIVIGSGHNALIAAAYLTKAGRRVLVLEKNDRPGGLVRTDELTLPGFKHDTYSAAHPLFTTSAVYAELEPELSRRGLRYVNTDLPTGVSMADGSTAVVPRTAEALIAEAERLHAGDGAALGEMLHAFTPYVGPVFSLFEQDLASPQARETLAKLIQDPAFSYFAFGTARQLISTLQSETLKAMLAPWVMHLGRTPDEAGSAIWLPLVVLALMGGGMPIPEGGSEMLAKALAALVTDWGGSIRCDCSVEQILVKNKKAVGVRTAHGETFEAGQGVIASVNPDQLYLRLLSETAVDTVLKGQAARFHYGRGCVQISLALNEAPRWRDERFHQIGQPHLSSGLDNCTLAIAQAMSGLLPVDPTFTVDCSSNLDPGRAPVGKAVMRVQVLEVPTQPRGDAANQIKLGSNQWDDSLKERFADRILDIVEQHIPNVKSALLARHILSPAELTQFSPNQGPGDPYGGSHDLSQSYIYRPLPNQPSHRTAISNVFMVGAATWPGHGINGGSGRIVAQEILRSTVHTVY
ncbi:phytoene desaturase family protein [Spirosoma pulveris]